MEVLFACITAYVLSTFISIGVDLKVTFKVIKDLADNGYLIDYKRLSNFSLTSNKNLFVRWLMPGINLVNAIKMVNVYSYQKNYLIDEFRVTGTLIEMTEEEREEYNKKPTAFKALTLSCLNGNNLENKYDVKKVKENNVEDIKTEEKVKSNKKFEFSITIDGKVSNIIIFEGENEKVKIETSGYIKTLPKKEQNKIVLECLRGIQKEIKNKKSNDLENNLYKNIDENTEEKEKRYTYKR